MYVVRFIVLKKFIHIFMQLLDNNGMEYNVSKDGLVDWPFKG